MIESGNLFAGIPDTLAAEQITALLTTPNVRIERIVSHGHTSPPDFWYNQPQAEWVIVLAGSAAVAFEGETSPRTLRSGDHLHIPATRSIASYRPTPTNRRSGSPYTTGDRSASPKMQ